MGPGLTHRSPNLAWRQTIFSGGPRHQLSCVVALSFGTSPSSRITEIAEGTIPGDVPEPGLRVCSEVMMNEVGGRGGLSGESRTKIAWGTVGHDSHVSSELWEDVLWDQNSWGLRWGDGKGYKGEAAWSDRSPHLFNLCKLHLLPSLLCTRNRRGTLGAKLPPHRGSFFSGISEIPAALQKKLKFPASGKGIQDPITKASCQYR